jgi:hypothetical protein
VNKYKFIDYLHQPTTITKEQQSELEQVVKEYPYFQTARTLIAKTAKQADPKQAKHYVNTAAMYVYDRRYLRKFLDTELFFIEFKSDEAARHAKAAAEVASKPTKPIAESTETAAPTQVEKKSQAHKPSLAPAAPATAEQTASPPASRPEVKKAVEPSAQVAKKPQSAEPSPKVTPTAPPSAKQPSSQPGGRPDAEKSVVPPVIEPKKPATAESNTTPSSNEPLEEIPTAPTSDLDKLIAEVFQDMEELRQSKARFNEWQEKNDMEEAVDKAISAASDQKGIKPAEPVAAKEATVEAPAETKEDPKPSATHETASKAILDPRADKRDEKPVEEPTATEPQSKEPVVQTVPSENKESPAEEIKPAQKASTKKAPAKKKTVTLTKAKKPAPKAKKTTTKTSEVKPVSKEAERKVTKKAATAKKSPTTKTFTSISDKQKPETKSDAPVEELVKKVAADSTPNTELEPKKEEKSTETSNKKVDPVQAEKIIDEFIEKRPTISKPDLKANAADKNDLAEGSSRFHADIASEYLAEIYIEQGKVNRAIEIYENLCLKFPEKKSYFAGQIKKLKKD